jgi:hypothetical protein
MANQPAQQPTDRQPLPPGAIRGGYHSRGVPGEEAAFRSHMRVVKLADSDAIIRTTQPIKGGLTAESTSEGRLEATAPHTAASEEPAVHVLARRDATPLETPVFCAGESGGEEAIAAFTDAALASAYLVAAGWSATHTPARLLASAFSEWLLAAQAEGVQYLAIDPERQAHERGQPQPVVPLAHQTDDSSASLFRALTGQLV